MAENRDALNMEDRQAWRSWLEANASTASEAWLVIRKKHASPPGLSLEEAVEEALCFGWIDGTLNRRDDRTYLLRFSPRRPGSVWSMNNIRRVGKLVQSGSMTEAGLAAVRQGRESGQWQAAIEREDLEAVPADLRIALRKERGASAAYRRLPDSIKKRYLYWLQSAKREATRKKRIAEIVTQVLAGQ